MFGFKNKTLSGMKLVDYEEKLFAKWQERRPELAKDGVINEKEYLGSSKKVLYVLKEVNDWKNGDLRQFVRDGARWRTWNNLARWQQGIKGYYEQGKIDYRNRITQDDRIEMLKAIAIINLKKESGLARAKMGLIKQHAQEDESLLREQVQLYQPDLVVCCGTGDIVLNHINLFESPIEKDVTSDGTHYGKSNGRLIIDFFHPQVRKGKYFLFYKLIDALKAIQ